MRSCSQRRSTCRRPPDARMGEWAHRTSGEIPIVPSPGTPPDLLKRRISGSERVLPYFDSHRQPKYEQCMRPIPVQRIGEHRISPDTSSAGMCVNAMEQTPLQDDLRGGIFVPIPLFMVPYDANMEPLSTGIEKPFPPRPHHGHPDRQLPPSSTICTGAALGKSVPQDRNGRPRG